MDQLLAKAKINDARLKSHLVKVIGRHLGSLSEPCYYPKLKKHYYEFLKMMNLTEKRYKRICEKTLERKERS